MIQEKRAKYIGKSKTKDIATDHKFINLKAINNSIQNCAENGENNMNIELDI